MTVSILGSRSDISSLKGEFYGCEIFITDVEKEHIQEKISESWHLNGKSSAMIDWLEITDYLHYLSSLKRCVTFYNLFQVQLYLPCEIGWCWSSTWIFKRNAELLLLRLFAQPFVCLSQPQSLDSLAILKYLELSAILKSDDSLHLILKQSQGKVTP